MVESSVKILSKNKLILGLTVKTVPLVLFFSIKKFCHLLHGVDFSLQLGHEPVVQALTKKSQSLNGHQVWQLAYIMEFDVEPFYLASQDNTVANALSWAPVSLLPSPAINTP